MNKIIRFFVGLALVGPAYGMEFPGMFEMCDSFTSRATSKGQSKAQDDETISCKATIAASAFPCEIVHGLLSPEKQGVLKFPSFGFLHIYQYQLQRGQQVKIGTLGSTWIVACDSIKESRSICNVRHSLRVAPKYQVTKTRKIRLYRSNGLFFNDIKDIEYKETSEQFQANDVGVGAVATVIHPNVKKPLEYLIAKGSEIHQKFVPIVAELKIPAMYRSLKWWGKSLVGLVAIAAAGLAYSLGGSK